MEVLNQTARTWGCIGPWSNWNPGYELQGVLHFLFYPSLALPHWSPCLSLQTAFCCQVENVATDNFWASDRTSREVNFLSYSLKNPREGFYKGFYLVQLGLVLMPHSMRARLCSTKWQPYCIHMKGRWREYCRKEGEELGFYTSSHQ